MQSGAKTLSAGGGASLCCLLLLWLIYSHLLREGQLAVGTCEIVMLNRDSSVPRRTIARQTARCACRRGQIAGTTRARPACVDAFAQGAVVGCRENSNRFIVVIHVLQKERSISTPEHCVHSPTRFPTLTPGLTFNTKINK
uniref:TAFA chemokine like family member 5, like n=1 Tax=Gasterosteus aculeatus aculeatus TaxID=481459 RepID=A0AAQ4PK46_GASAC